MNQKGFSIIEVMVAVVILVSMCVGIYSTMHRVLEGSSRVEMRDDVLHSIRLSINKLVEDLAQAFIANKDLEGANGIYKTGMIGSSDKLDFSTFNHYHYIKDGKDADQITVGYSLKKDEGDTFQLSRRESLRLGEDIEEGGDEYVLVESVKEIKFGYYDSKKEEWVSEWDSTKISVFGRLPLAVKIEIAVVVTDEDNENEKKEYTYSTIARVDMYQDQVNF